MKWSARARAAVEREALAVVGDPGASEQDLAAAKAFLSRPKLELDKLPPAYVLITVAASYVRRSEPIPSFVLEELAAELDAAPPALHVTPPAKCPRCSDLGDEDLSELREALDDDLDPARS